MLHLKPIVLMLLSIVAISASGCAGSQAVKDDVRKPDPRGSFHIGFSYDPPEGWTIANISGSSLPFALGPENFGFRSNINIMVEYASIAFEDYYEKTLESFDNLFPEHEELSSEPFTTTSGINGMKYLMHNNVQGYELRQCAYVFPGATGQYVTIVSTTLRAGGHELDATFDAAAKTFRNH